MSWYIKTVGAPAEVSKIVKANPNIPVAFTSTVECICAAPLPSDCQVLVESNGHADNTIGIHGGSKLIVEIIESASPVVKPIE